MATVVKQVQESSARSVMRRHGSRVVIAGALLAGLIVLAGCGQKGPLYLPDEGGEVVTRPAGQTQQAPQSPETAPQPSTQPRPNSTDSEKKTEPPR